MKKFATLFLAILFAFSGYCQLKGGGEELMETRGQFPCGIDVSWHFTYSDDFGPSMEHITLSVMGDPHPNKTKKLNSLNGRTLYFYIRKKEGNKNLFRMKFKIDYLLDSPHDIDCASLVYIHSGAFTGSSLTKKGAEKFFKKGFYVDWITVE